MNSIKVINETYTNGYRVEVLDFISLFSILCGIFVIVSKNPIVSVLFLIGLFLNISLYLILLGLNFIGLSYLLVYVGAVSILFLFILMLINVRISELLSYTNNTIPLAIIIAILFNIPVNEILPYSIVGYTNFPENLKISINNIYTYYLNYFFQTLNFVKGKDQVVFATSKLWDGNLAEVTHISTLGNIMYTSYFIWLIIASIILLLAMVGAIIITIKQKN